MFEVIAAVIFCVYFIFLVIFITGLKKRFNRDLNYTPSLSVIVCARNEEHNIKQCLESLAKVQYPDDKIEFIVVDDNSSDRTGEIIDEFTMGNLLFRKVTAQESAALKGKINALHCGISESKGEIIFLTDADCTVERSWIRTMVSYYKENTGMVCGFTSINGEGIFSAVQDLDLTFLLSVASGTANTGKPVSCIGNNISFRRKAYDETGGFEKMPFSVTEDYLLMNEIARLKKYDITFPVDKDALVNSKPIQNLRDLISQKLRWGKGGLQGSAYSYSIILTAYFANLALLLVPLFFSSVSLYLAVFKISADYFFLQPVCRMLGKKNNVVHFIMFEIYYSVYLVILPLLLLINKKISWKGREF